ncbi:MAG: UDP-N-acetylmuramoyl-L-alanine--D-glutamate ligase, partial [Gemmatimonadaceae bacterium]
MPMPPREAGEVVVIGLGRSGAAAAALLLDRGYAVYACDDGASDGVLATAAELTARGATVRTSGHDNDRIAKAALVVVSPGVPPDA